jgi:uncharacterized protein (TIGR03382 family)
MALRNSTPLVAASAPTATGRGQRLMAIVLGAGLAACAVEPATGTLTAASTVDDHVATGCSTAVVIGLSQQIADEVGCILNGELAPFSEGNGISFTGGAVLPYLAPDAQVDLRAAVAAQGGTLEVTSAYRTVVQQYLLDRWYQDGRCGITAAATPGSSNHESGRALDVGNYGTWISALGAQGWAHDVPGDDVHFDHLGSADLRGSDVHAFQRLWNRNHPDDLIDEDGVYGPATAARIGIAPAEGFALGASCAVDAYAVAARIATTPGPLAPGASGTFVVELTNTGTAPWPATTRLVTSAPIDRASPLYDPAHWTSPADVTALGGLVAPGAAIDVEVAVIAPMVMTATHYDELFALADGPTRFGMLDLPLDVVPAGPGPGDGGGGVSGGCAAGGDPRGATMMIIALALLSRRRRASPRASSR